MKSQTLKRLKVSFLSTVSHFAQCGCIECCNFYCAHCFAVEQITKILSRISNVSTGYSLYFLRTINEAGALASPAWLLPQKVDGPERTQEQTEQRSHSCCVCHFIGKFKRDRANKRKKEKKKLQVAILQLQLERE